MIITSQIDYIRLGREEEGDGSTLVVSMFGSSSEDDAVVLATRAMQEKKENEERRDLEKSHMVLIFGIRPNGQKRKRKMD